MTLMHVFHFNTITENMPGIHRQKAQAKNTNKRFHQSEAGGKTALTQAK